MMTGVSPSSCSATAAGTTHFANDPAVLEPQLADQRHSLRHRRRDAEGFSRADGRRARLLGAAVADRAAAAGDGGREEGNRRRHHRQVEARHVARSRAGTADRLGCASHRRQRRAAHRRHHAGAATRHHSTADGGGADLYAALRIVWTHPADWLCERRQSPAGTRGVAPEGSRRSSLPRRVTRADCAAVVDRERDPRAGGRGARLRDLTAHSRDDHLGRDEHDAAGYRRCAPARARRETGASACSWPPPRLWPASCSVWRRRCRRRESSWCEPCAARSRAMRDRAVPGMC